MLNNHTKLMQFFSVAKEVTGRKKLQKMIYILQKCDVPFEEKYQFHVYGPYSEELTLRMEELCNLGFVHEEKEEKSNYHQYHYQITKDGHEFLSQFAMEMPDMSERIGLLNNQSSRFLELVSTMLYFDDLPHNNMNEKINTVKPKQNFSNEEVDEAWEFISKLKH
ncbi:YwgA family protein [Virgibacillus byunsanensis]|uniref:YwgA family protein n=1 Tax=Virgibacillus byunsanensis TaxID=570945 RepID=A0ABW3LHJ4_9BACI